MSHGNRILIAALCLGSSFFLLGPTAPSSDIILAKLVKPHGPVIPARFQGAISGLQELSSSWIAAMPRSVREDLSIRGIESEVLDAEPAGKSYFLISIPRPGAAKDIEGLGHVKILDDETGLFWRDDAREAREVLPAEFKIKKLSLDDGVPLTSDGRSAAGPAASFGGILKLPLYDPLIARMTGGVTASNLRGSILALQSFLTRYATTTNCELAGDYLYAYFLQLGLISELDPFSFSSNRYASRNVIAVLPGKKLPQNVVIVCAHYDSYSSQAATSAPGADDNASGTAAVMEIARILAGYEFSFTLKFACFSAEEWGFYGSQHYVQEAVARGEKIIGVINLDMIAYADALPEDLDLVVDQRSEWLANRFTICAALYAPLPLLKVVNPGLRWSDHAPFWDKGYSALCGIEDYAPSNPYYHKTTDTVDKLNLDFATSVTKIALAVAADLAQPASSIR